ncbi:amino acid ABC transporter substrate-binding protein [Phenylobacterium sp.]|uniref:amino acid ABC transporter substrate-binding protein n=1 Tax=Phenylobacterium sp. TaxID=1871053 RepID=UPI002E36FD2F|nr:amino acid ABC transporter substrate-binding protein [Phenylobacterium sp.]HEX2561258.1 amino acid ABC transporter substrate-binding protein [Phenylobacterium sp.]
MIRRLCATTALALALVACGEREEAAEPSPPPPAAAPSAPATYQPAVSPTLAAVRKRGWLSCGVHPELAGFSVRDVRGVWRGFDVDVCRALAAATLGDANAVRFRPLSAAERFAVLKSGEIDVLSRNTSWTFSRDAGLGVDFPVITYFDGQGFMVRRALNLTSVHELSGARICVQAGTDAEQNLSDYMRARAIDYQAVVVESEEAGRASYQSEACDAMSADLSALAAARTVMNSPTAHVILPDIISKEPLGPAVRQDDPVWADIVRWTMFALIVAEELELRSADVAEAKGLATAPEARRLLGLERELGPLLGLRQDWAFQAIRQVGAYDELFRRNLGEGSALRLARGLNARWNADPPGLLYAPPMR